MYSEEKYIVYLSDGKRYLLYKGPFYNVEHNKYHYKKFTVRTVCDAPNEDWKTAMVHNQPCIPAGTELVVNSVMTNYYGRFIEVDYEGWHYSIHPHNLEYVKSEDIWE